MASTSEYTFRTEVDEQCFSPGDFRGFAAHKVTMSGKVTGKAEMLASVVVTLIDRNKTDAANALSASDDISDSLYQLMSSVMDSDDP